MVLMSAAWCPSDLSNNSLGLCEHAPWIDEVVDFDKLKTFPGEFYMNAYCLEDKEMTIFNKEQITPAHFRAALAFPFIYPPFKFNGKTYIEGSALDTLCFRGLLKYWEKRTGESWSVEAVTAERQADGAASQGSDEAAAKRRKAERLMEPLRNVVIFDVLSAKDIIREPKTLYDAWVQSIMIPLVEIAKDDKELFKYKHNDYWKLNLMEINFKIPDKQWPHVLDWSYSNLSTLYDVGYEAGETFYENNKTNLPLADED